MSPQGFPQDDFCRAQSETALRRLPTRWLSTRHWSLRRKLIVACVLVELGAMLMVLIGGSRMLQEALQTQALAQSRQVVSVLDQALATPLAQRDFVTVQQVLDRVRDLHSIPYLVVFDHFGAPVAASGWDPSRSVPPVDTGPINLDRDGAIRHLAEPIQAEGHAIGRLALGLSMEPLRMARDAFRATGLFIAALALAVSVGVMAVICHAVTRNLAAVSAASRRVAAGEFDIQVPVQTRDEVGLLAASFNRMAATIAHRLSALQQSRHQQQLHLVAAREERARLISLLGALRSGILFVDADQRVLYSNDQFARIWSLGAIAPGTTVAQILPALLRQVTPGCEALVTALLAPRDGEPPADCEITLTHGRRVSQRLQWVREGSAVGGGCIWLHEDITLDRQTQQRARLALLDPLTHLYNRSGLFETLHAAIDGADRTDAGLTLIIIDLDDFNHANDLAGHRVGDQILVAVAQALSGLLQPDMVAARMGGDEFAIIAPGNNAEQAGGLATRLVQLISALRFDRDALRIRIGCSAGVAFFPTDAQSADQLVACADRAMVQAKVGGKNGYCLYHDNAAHSQAEFDRVAWNGRIHGALRDQRLKLQFQPVHRVSDLGIVYYEALVRMVDEDDASQLIGPTAFVPYAERSGKIRQIDRWVFQACIDKLVASPPAVCIAANLSARSLDDPSFVDFLREALQRCDVDPGRLHIELTETAAMGDLIAARPMIAALRSVGCAVHLDDFGSGFSSFAHLKLLEVDGIKIDGSFIRDLTSDPGNQLVVSSLIQIARSLNKTTVAECVEDAATLDALRALGVDHVQGFHLGRPATKLVDRA